MGNVRARIFNNGALFFRGNPSVYEVPKGSGIQAIFASGIWIAGFVDGELRGAGSRYGEWEFWSGPLDDDGNPLDDCVRYDHLWEITRKEIAAFNETGVATKNLLDWPWHLGAPVLDGDGIDGNYDLEAGDRPALIGDQMIWWVMNDVAGEHRSMDTAPIGLEVHGSAFAFHRPGSYIDNVTFYRYRFINKNRKPSEDAYFSLYADLELGDWADNYVGAGAMKSKGRAVNLLDWPWHLGAPVLDGDGIDGNYDLEAGDRPALIGDQMIWWVMNDVAGEHRSMDTAPIGLEVHGSAFAFHRPGSYIDNVTFYRYRFINKNRKPSEDAYFSLYADLELGDWADNYVGSDSTLHLGYVYNSDNLDNADCGGYGEAPPALGYTFLRTAVADADGLDNDRDDLTDEPGEQIGMSSFVHFPDGPCVICTPSSAPDYYNYMQARWRDGKPITLGGEFGRYFSDIPTKFSYPGDPIAGTYWSERNLDDQGTSRDPGWRTFNTTTGPFTLQPGEEQEIIFAIVWSRGTDNFDSIRQLKKEVKRLHEVADDILVPGVPAKASAPEPEPVLGFAQNFPNPFTETTTIRYSVPQEMAVRLRIYDLLGREITTLVDECQRPGVYTADFDGAGLPGGLYVYRIEMDHRTYTRQMVLVR